MLYENVFGRVVVSPLTVNSLIMRVKSQLLVLRVTDRIPERGSLSLPQIRISVN